MGQDTACEGARFDLHSHSTFSDGSASVEELIEQAKAAGLSGLAITDHDSLSQLSAVRMCARRAAFPVLAGLEISAASARSGRKVHILCYGAEAQGGAGPLEKLVAETLARRTANTLWQAWTIMRAGDRACGCGAGALTLDEVARAGAASTGAYKQHIMEALCGKPYRNAEYQAIYQRLFKNGGIAERDISYPDAVRAVRAVREQGGIAVLAHPGQLDSWGDIPDLVAAGLRGIEARHPDHSLQDVARAKEAAREHGLFITGGSDFHGRFGKPEALGCCTVSAEEAGDALAALFERERTLK